jgi:hypothetical protein
MCGATIYRNTMAGPAFYVWPAFYLVEMRQELPGIFSQTSSAFRLYFLVMGVSE